VAVRVYLDQMVGVAMNHAEEEAAKCRDYMTKKLILAMVHGRYHTEDANKRLVDQCRKMARYIQDTNEFYL